MGRWQLGAFLFCWQLGDTSLVRGQLKEFRPTLAARGGMCGYSPSTSAASSAWVSTT